ncbi:hypothetical protein [Actinoplanes sp. NPDC051859]|uniref:hypothetical protein n=1 Tax=Actinoplanes sp. NPDC051859 TaxID=3363909 RepID=UPI0037B144D0
MSVSTWAAETAGSGLGTDKMLLAAVSATLGFASSFAIEQVKSRKAPRKELSWSRTIEEPKLKYGAQQVDQLQISFDGARVERPVIIRCTVTNSGNETVKGQVIRFPRVDGAQILEYGIDPVPKREMGVIPLHDDFDGDVQFRIGHLEPKERVAFYLIADGGRWGNAEVVLHNPDGGVKIRREDGAQARDEKAHVIKFFFGIVSLLVTTMLIALAALCMWLLSKFSLSEVGFVVSVAGLTVLFVAVGVGLLRTTKPAFRAIVAWSASTPQSGGTYINGQGAFIADGGASVQIHHAAERHLDRDTDEDTVDIPARQRHYDIL